MPANREGFTVRILRNGLAAPAGVGFLVDERHIVTCAHVVNVALGRRDQRAQEQPGPTEWIGVDFPLLGDAAGAPMRRCRVAAWVPPPTIGTAGGDVAGLVIVGEGLPAGARPARLAEQASRPDHAVEVFGYPSTPLRHERGVRTPARLRGTVGGGLLQLDTDTAAAVRLQPGYSGSPIVAVGQGGDEVLGMLAVASLDGQRDAYAIPVAQLAEAWPAVLGTLTIPACPYRGLEAFTAEDAEAGVFVGREEEVSQLRDMLRRQALVVVTGPSGVGKSSLVNAGLARVLRDDGWVTGIFRPQDLPFESLARTLLRIEQPARTPTLEDLGNWVDRVRSAGLAALQSLSLLIGQPIFLVVDQLEQVLDPDVCPPAVSADFLDLLLRAQPVDRLRVVCTLRADFLPGLLRQPDAGVYLRDRLFTLSPMGKERMKRVITEPAKVRGVEYEPGLAELIARDAGGGGGLPLLGFALTELWSRQRQHQITLAGYHSLGGVMGALSSYAEHVYRELSGQFAEGRIRRVLLALVRSRGGASAATGRAIPRERLGADWTVAEALAERRLVIVGHDSLRNEDTAQVAHEALIREWPRFAAWVDEDADFQHWLTALEERVADAELLPDTRLAEADRWLAERLNDIPPEVRELVEDSKSEWQRRITELQYARNHAEARRLAAAAELALASRGVSLQVAIALGIESLQVTPGLEGDTAIRDAIRLVSVQHGRLDRDGGVEAVAFSPDGSRVATANNKYTAWIFDADTGAELCRLEHASGVKAVAFSPTGSRIATGTWDGTAHVFDAVTGVEISRMAHEGRIEAVVFSPDGSRIATGSLNDSARVFDAETGREVCHLNRDSRVDAVAFSPDGSRVVTGSFDGSVRVFDAATGHEICRQEHDGSAGSVAFSPDGHQVASGSQDGAARVFDATTGTELCRLQHGDQVNAVAFTPDGSQVATASNDKTARVFDVASGAESYRLEHGGTVTAVVVNADGSLLATHSAAGARVFNAVTGAEVCRMNDGGTAEAVAFSPDGSRIAVGSVDGSTRVFDTVAGAEQRRFGGTGDLMTAAAFDSGGSRVATSASQEGVQVFDAGTGASAFRLASMDFVSALVFSPDGSLIAVCCFASTLSVFDTTAGTEVWSFDPVNTVQVVAFSPDGSRVAISCRGGSVGVFDARTGTAICYLAEMMEEVAVSAMAFSSDGQCIIVGRERQGSLVCDAATGAAIRQLSRPDTVYAMTFSTDGSKLAISGFDLDDSARLFDAVTWAEMCDIGAGSFVYAVAFSPDGSRVATGGDRSAQVFDAASGAEICRVDHDDLVAAVAFSPDGSQVVTGSADNSARVFDAATGTEACRLEHDDTVDRVAFSPDGTRVLTCSRDGSARIWIVGTEQLIRQAQGRLTRNLTQQEWSRYFGAEPYRKTRVDLP